MKQEIIIGYILINLIVFLAYGIDKNRAVNDRWRIKEKTLLMMAVLGIFGAVCGMSAFHHKTRKLLFRTGIPVILVIELITFYYLHVILRLF